MKSKKNNLESREYLKLDTLLLDRNQLEQLFDNKTTRLLTIRNDKENLKGQLRFLGIDDIITNVVALDSKGDQTKLKWVEKIYGESEEIIMVGDSETDLNVGKRENTKIILVKTGLRDPYVIINDKKISAAVVNSIVDITNNMKDGSIIS